MAEDAKPVGREGYGVSQLGNLGGTKRLRLVRLHCFTLSYHYLSDGNTKLELFMTPYVIVRLCEFHAAQYFRISTANLTSTSE